MTAFIHGLTEQLRFTAFPAEDAVIGSFKRWVNMFGGAPEEGHFLKNQNLMVEAGPHRGNRLVLQVMTPLRFDWNLVPLVDDKSEDAEFKLQNIGPLTQAISSFREIVDKWLDGAGPLQRIAFGAVLLFRVPSRIEGYRTIQPYLTKVTLDPEGSSDFIYQINRPRPMPEIEGLKVNRLTKWSVFQYFTQQVVMGPGVTHQMSGPDAFACRLEMDINTMPDFSGPLPGEKLSTILDKLIGMCNEIAENGDVP